jgi:hypothetical protein
MKAKAIAGFLGLLVTMPIWFYLIYQILVRVNASELMFFLFWVYVPVTTLVGVLTKMADKD